MSTPVSEGSRPVSIAQSISTVNTTDSSPRRPGFIPLVTVVDFHHARGPEVEKWFGAPEDVDPAVKYDWTLLPFMALSDGAHASTEDFSYFTLLRHAEGDSPATSLFGISCTRQMDASQLLNRPPEVTRSTVQKAVVVIADSPQYFGMLRERLSMVTSAWFQQREFTDCEILRRFQESLKEEKERGTLSEDEDRDQYLGMSLRELVREFRWQTLVLLKCCLLQPKMLFFGSRCERLCMMQFSLISLVPGLLRNLQDCAAPELNEYEKRLSKPTSLRTSDRNSLLSYMGLPLQIFGKGSLFGPYTPLQQLDILADFGTRSYIVGSTNSLLLQQKDRYSDILINLDDDTINITSSSLRTALALSASDRRWIDFITQEVNDTWDEKNPGRPNHMGYRGSEEFIRLQFEEYLLSMISCVKYHNYLAQHANNPKMALPHIDGDPSTDFGVDWVEHWSKTENFRIWNAHTDSLLFDIVEPKHPCAGGLTVDDVQRRIQQQVQDLHLDERFAAGREVLGRNAAAAREKASTMFNKFYADMESMREAQRKRAEEAKAASIAEKRSSAALSIADVNKSQQTGSSVGAKAGAYIGSWATWAGEKRKQGWGSKSSSGGGGWGFGSKKKGADSGSERTLTPRSGSPRLSSSSFAPTERSNLFRASMDTMGRGEDGRPTTQHSFSESVLDGVSTDGSESPTVSPKKPQRPVSPVSTKAKVVTKAESRGIDEVVADKPTVSQSSKDSSGTKAEPPVVTEARDEPTAVVEAPMAAETQDSSAPEEAEIPVAKKEVQDSPAPKPELPAVAEKQSLSAVSVETPVVTDVQPTPEVKSVEVEEEQSAPEVKSSVVVEEQSAPDVEIAEVEEVQPAPVVESTATEETQSAPVVEKVVVEEKQSVPEVEAAEVEETQSAPVVESVATEETHSVPEVEDVVTEETQSAPEVESVVVEEAQSAPEVDREVVEEMQSVLEVEDVVAEGTQSAPEAESVVVEEKQPAPEVESPTVAGEQSVPETENVVVEESQSAPEVTAESVQEAPGAVAEALVSVEVQESSAAEEETATAAEEQMPSEAEEGSSMVETAIDTTETKAQLTSDTQNQPGATVTAEAHVAAAAEDEPTVNGKPSAPAVKSPVTPIAPKDSAVEVGAPAVEEVQQVKAEAQKVQSPVTAEAQVEAQKPSADPELKSPVKAVAKETSGIEDDEAPASTA